MALLFAWDFSEASGAVVDYSGNGRGFALTGTSGRGAAGSGYTYGGAEPGKKALLQTAAEIQLGPAVTGLNPAARTLVFWAKLAMADPAWLMEWYNATLDTGALGALMLTGSQRFRVKDAGNAAFEVAIAAPDGAVYHQWAVTHDGTTFRGYKDGVQIGVDTAVGAFMAATAIRVFDMAGANVRLGDTRFYDTALTAADLATLMTTPVNPSSGVSLAPQSSAQVQVPAVPALTQTYLAAPAPTVQAQAPATTALTQVHQLAVQAVQQLQVPAVPVLVQVHVLAAAGVAQVQSAAVVPIGSAVTLTPAAVAQLQAAGVTSLVQAQVLVPAGVHQDQVAPHAVFPSGSYLLFWWDGTTLAPVAVQGVLTDTGIVQADVQFLV